jgi:putative transposase
MARTKSIGIRKVLARILPRRQLQRLADEVGLTQRQRKVRVHALFWTLVLGFGAGRERTLAGLRRAYEKATGCQLVPSAFYDRFTPALVRLLRAVAGLLIAQMAEPTRKLAGPLATFRDLVLTDSTVIRLHDLLKKAFPACRTNHTQAALKLHTVMSATGAGLRSIKITAERAHDGPIFTVGKWVKDRLLLFDLGYFRFQLFSCIDRNGGYFIVRLKKSADPVVVAVHRRWRGRSVPMLGRRVSEFLARLQRQTVDVEVEVSFKRRVYGGIRHKDRQRFRLVGVRDPLTREYHLYLTNIPPHRLTPDDIAQTYAARWAIELFFRELKTHYRAEDMPSAKRQIVEALIYAVLITFVVSRALLAALRKKLGALASRVPEERWAGLFADAALDILRLMVWPPGRAAALTRLVDATLLHESVDPNVGRALLLRRVESRTQYQHRVLVGGGRV